MSAIKEYALGVCYAHPKEMYDLYDLLCGDAHAAGIIQQAEAELTGTPVKADRELRTVLDEIAAILAPVTRKFDRMAVLFEVQGAAMCGTDYMEGELHYWRGRCTA